MNYPIPDLGFYHLPFLGEKTCGNFEQERLFDRNDAVKNNDHQYLLCGGSAIFRFPDRTTGIGSVINSYLTCSEELDDRAIHLLFSANRYCANQLFSSNVQVLLSTSPIHLKCWTKCWAVRTGGRRRSRFRRDWRRGRTSSLTGFLLSFLLTTRS